MKIIKGFLAAALSVSLVLCNITVLAERYSEEGYGLVDRLGILDYFKVQNFEDERTVTRAEFADALARMNGESYRVYSKFENSFSDVSSKHYAVNAINFVSEKGYMIGYGDSCFYPEKEIKLMEAVKSITAMMGYSEMAEFSGGYPFGYFTVASEIKMMEGITLSSDSTLKYKDLKRLIYNSLFCEMHLMKFDGIDSVRYENNGETLLNRFFEIYEIEGIVDANSVTALADGIKVNKESILIGEEEIKTNERVDDLIGYNVNAFYKENDGEKELFYIYKNEKNNSVRVYANDIYSFEDGKVWYENELEDDVIKIDKASDILKNNVLFTSSYIPDELFKKSDFVTFIDNDNDQKAEVILIESGIPGVIQKIDYEGKSIYDGLDASRVTKLENLNQYEIFDEDGVKLSLEDLRVGDVYTVYGETSDYAKIIRSNSRVTGMVSEVNEEGIKINDSFFKYNLNTDNYFKVGTTAEALLDHNGLIVSSAVKNTDFLYGYIKKVWIDEENEENIKIRILKTDGEFENFNASRLSIDKTMFNNFEMIKTYIEGLPYKLVRYRVSEDARILEIDTVKDMNEPDESSLKILFDCYAGENVEDSYRYISNQRSFMGKTTVKSNVKIFVVPENEDISGTDEYAVMDSSYIKNEQSYSFVSFNATDENVEADVLLVIGSDSTPVKYNTSLTLISSIRQTIDEDDEIVYEITGYTDGNKITVYINGTDMDLNVRHADDASKKSTIAKGDIVRLTKDSENKVLDIDLLYDRSMGESAFGEGFFSNSMTIGGYYENVRVICGKIYGIYSDVVQVAAADYDMSDGYSADNINNYLLNGFKIFVVEKNEVRKGKQSELYDYVHNRDMASNCILYTRWGEGRMLIIYK